MVETVDHTIPNDIHFNSRNNNSESDDDELIDFGYEREDDEETASMTSNSSSESDTIEVDNQLHVSSTSAFVPTAHEDTTVSAECIPEIDAAVFRREAYK